MKKNCIFVDTEFGKTCDELVLNRLLPLLKPPKIVDYYYSQTAVVLWVDFEVSEASVGDLLADQETGSCPNRTSWSDNVFFFVDLD